MKWPLTSFCYRPTGMVEHRASSYSDSPPPNKVQSSTLSFLSLLDLFVKLSIFIFHSIHIICLSLPLILFPSIVPLIILLSTSLLWIYIRFISFVSFLLCASGLFLSSSCNRFRNFFCLISHPGDGPADFIHSSLCPHFDNLLFKPCIQLPVFWIYLVLIYKVASFVIDMGGYWSIFSSACSV